MSSVFATITRVPPSHTRFSWQQVMLRNKYFDRQSIHTSCSANEVNLTFFQNRNSSNNSRTSDMHCPKAKNEKDFTIPDTSLTIISSQHANKKKNNSKISSSKCYTIRNLIDTHSHIHFAGLEATIQALARHAKTNTVPCFIVMATYTEMRLNSNNIQKSCYNKNRFLYNDFRAPQADWSLVATLARKFPKYIIPAFGIHPWYAGLANLSSELLQMQSNIEIATTYNKRQPLKNHAQTKDVILTRHDCAAWLQQLTDLLQTFKHAVIGEVGLDKMKGCLPQLSIPSMPSRLEYQTIILKQQLDVAALMGL